MFPSSDSSLTAAVPSETDSSVWVRYKYDKALQLVDHIIKGEGEDAFTATPGGVDGGKEEKRMKKGKNKGGKNK
jgi:hypothetical protein